jgi:hypothetical protein
MKWTSGLDDRATNVSRGMPQVSHLLWYLSGTQRLRIRYSHFRIHTTFEVFAAMNFYMAFVWHFTSCNVGDIKQRPEEPTAWIFRVGLKMKAVGSSGTLVNTSNIIQTPKINIQTYIIPVPLHIYNKKADISLQYLEDFKCTISEFWILSEILYFVWITHSKT